MIPNELVEELGCVPVDVLLTLCDQLDDIFPLTAAKDEFGTSEDLEDDDPEGVHVEDRAAFGTLVTNQLIRKTIK